MRYLYVGLFLFIVPAVGAECTGLIAKAAEISVDRLQTWRSVATWRRQYGNCDDGGIAEGVSDAIARLLANKWREVPKLARLIKLDPRLEPFVLGHLNESDDWGDLDRIAAQAHSSCPKESEALCKRLISRIASLDRSNK